MSSISVSLPAPTTNNSTSLNMAVIKTLAQFRRKYKLIQLLGEGGYGAVFVCQQIRTGKLRAVKTMDDIRCRNRTWCPKRKQPLSQKPSSVTCGVSPL